MRDKQLVFGLAAFLMVFDRQFLSVMCKTKR